MIKVQMLVRHADWTCWRRYFCCTDLNSSLQQLISYLNSKVFLPAQ